eukprot:3626759-Amphidinium_carterae.1
MTLGYPSIVESVELHITVQVGLTTFYLSALSSVVALVRSGSRLLLQLPRCLTCDAPKLDASDQVNAHREFGARLPAQLG